MKKIFVLNGAPKYGISGGKLNKTISKWTMDFFQQKSCEIKYTDINEEYSLNEEVEKFVWADIVIYHTSIWWFYLPFQFKKYIDDVFSKGGDGRMLHNDGRHSINPTRNYGTGGALQGRKYMLTTTWNAPLESFTLKDEFFKQHNVDEGVMFGFHRMNEFIGMTALESLHFYDVIKNINIEQSKKHYLDHLQKILKVLKGISYEK